MKPWLILLNNFSHDLFTGLWCGSFVNLRVQRLQTCHIGVQGLWPGEEKVRVFSEFEAAGARLGRIAVIRAWS